MDFYNEIQPSDGMKQRFFLVTNNKKEYSSFEELLKETNEKIISAPCVHGYYHLDMKLRTIVNADTEEKEICMFLYEDQRGAL